MRLLILEDNIEFQQEIVPYVKKTFPECELYIFTTIREAQRKLLQNVHIDIAILDINLPDGDGIEYSKTIMNEVSAIIYLTCLDDRLLDAFDYKVYKYIMKQNIDLELPAVLERLKNELRNSKIKLTTNSGICIIDLTDIVCIELQNRILYLTVQKGVKLIVKALTLSKIFKMLDDGFLYLNQSTIVNMDYILSWDKNKVTMQNNKIIYVSRKYSKKAKKAFIERL